jgi:signal transduction histidine kinase
MGWRNSISARLTIFVSAAVLLGGLVMWPFWVWIDHWIDPSDAPDMNVLGHSQATYLVKHALRRGADGLMRVEATPDLVTYKMRNPGFRFAVFENDSGLAIVGSDLDLVSSIQSDRERYVFRSSLRIPGDVQAHPQFWMFSVKTPLGTFPIALYGYTFHWENIFYVILAELDNLGVISYIPGMLLAVLASSMIVRQGLSPLNRAGKELDYVHLNTLDRRLVVEDLPFEVSTFASAVNRTLSRLETSVATQKRFLANAAHELRTPIAILCAHIEEMDNTSHTSCLKRDVARIRMLVEQLLASAAISAHQVSVEGELDLSDSVLSVVSDCMPLAIGSRRQIEVECPSAPVMMIGDRRGVESVVMNFVDNALHAEPEGGTVFVCVHPDATISVSDHGAGVEPDAREKIFEPFWRDDKVQRIGTGLGLSIVKEVMESLGGRAWVEETPGGGATFKASFPRASSPSGQRSVPWKA